ncbi:DUF6434 domain-containing protein [Kitasatospora sp. NPDC051853]|uniref:DUF6434 domain-containing protein n=1 Tax=Kitasatospora sp. NPDC051853 TaxID=3364058 RepID=UPI0037B47428
MEAPSRPALTSELSGAELRRWYWTLDELTVLARAMGVPRGGGKAALTERLAAVLDGAAVAAPVRRAKAGRQLAEPLGADTVIPEGQRCGQVLRAYFEREVGPGFHFDAAMRAFVAEGAGRTLGEAVRHWHGSREEMARPQEVGAQFEFNRFLREWHAGHPDGSRGAAVAAWQAYRALPEELRRRAAGGGAVGG